MLVKRVTESDFIQAFEDMGRGNNFSIEALEALYEYLEETSESIGEPIELDVIAICGEFSEITFDEVLEEQGEDDHDDALDEFESQLEEDHGWVVRLSDSFVYQE
jgi:hypothetical protein